MPVLTVRNLTKTFSSGFWPLKTQVLSMKKIIMFAVCAWYAAPNVCSSYTLTHPLYNPGFFSVFNTVLGALDHYDQNKDHVSLMVNFEDQGHYYDATKGENWWQYYFEPIKLGNDQSYQDKFPTYQKVIFALETHFIMSRERGAELIEKYIKLKPHIQEKLDAFIHEHYHGPVIGVHYRGTDKKLTEAPAVPYIDVVDKLTEEISKSPESMIFVATDDENFLSLMKRSFPDKIIALDAIRSRTDAPVHLCPSGDHYKKGEDAVLDCLLLSKCSKLFKMASNLSETSLKFNPTLSVVQLNLDNSLATTSKDYSVYSTLNIALSLLDQYEKGDISGFTLDLPLQGEFGESNEWEHYFEPLSVGTDQANNRIALKGYEKAILRLKAMYKMPIQRAHELITRYIYHKPECTDKINTFTRKHFADHFVIGVYYHKPAQERDHMQPSIAYDQAFDAIDTQLKQTSEPYKVFVCTQDQAFLEAIREKYNNVVVYEDLQATPSNAMLDLINYRLLSETHVVIGTGSYQLKMVAQLNPGITIQELDTCWLEKK
jgi:hypothetical protein